ncbi:hypothetical protein I4U23_025100 [Adineta vaga]|nr:hypothetical protein I4U23_025100 [Adineta vaga]
MWKKFKEILVKHTTYKDESTITSGAATTAASIIDLRLSPVLSPQRTETVYHHQHQPCCKLGSHTLNKTDEHCRSLFSLLPTSLRSHHRQTSTKKGIDASTTRTTQLLTATDILSSDYDSDFMSQTYLNRTSSHVSCYSSMNRYGSIESLLHGHSKSNPANIHVIVRKNFEPFAQAHIGVSKGAIVTALFSRGPWLYIRNDSTGKTGYIPRLICSSYQHSLRITNLSNSSIDSSLIKDEEMIFKTDKCYNPPRKQVMNRYLSHSSAIIDGTKQRKTKVYFDERERRNTYTLPIAPRTKPSLSKDRRLTLSSINCPLDSNKQDSLTYSNNEIRTTITRDTDSSSTQDSGYSESTPFFLVQQATPDNEQPTLHSFLNTSKKSHAIPHYATVRRSSLLKVPDPINPSQLHQKQLNALQIHRQSLLNGRSMTDIITDDSIKRHSFGIFDDVDSFNSKLTNSNSTRRLPEFALIRNVRRDKTQIKPSIYNLPKSHIQIPASIFLNHHRQKQHFGSSHSAFRPVQPSNIHKRASSEGHSPSSSSPSSPSATSLSTSNSSINEQSQLQTRRRLSFDIRVPILSAMKSTSLTRSVCDQSSTLLAAGKLNQSSRTMSDILCDQFSEINLDAIEQDSLIQHQPRKICQSQHCLFTLIKDYRSTRASFAVKRGDSVYVLKQVGRACYLVRKQTNGQIGFIPKGLLVPATSTKVDTFLKMHEYRETII